MINKVYEILKPLKVPIKWQKRPSFDTTDTVMSYHFFNESELLRGDGLDTENGGALQIDIFSKKDYSSLAREVKALLKQNKFIFSEATDTLEELDKNTVIYHKVLTFKYIESEVLING